MLSASEIIRFVETYGRGPKSNAFRDWKFEDEDTTLWMAVAFSAGYLFHVVEDGELCAIGIVTPLATDNEFHLSQLICRRTKDMRTLYCKFKERFPDGIIKQYHRRGQLKVLSKHQLNRHLYGK